MSYDFLTLPRACDHVVASERLLIAQDNRHLYSRDNPTMRMPSPVNGLSTVSLRINDVPVPKDHPVYGWDILPDELSELPDKRSKIVFRHPVRARAIRIEASYITTAAYCHKCQGKSTVVDFELATDGSMRHVTGRKKLVQRCLKLLLTSVCSFYPGLVCPLRTYIGRKYGPLLDADSMAGTITSALGALKSIQSLQAQYQTLDEAEILREVTGVSATPDSSNPTIIRVKVGVASSADTEDTLNIGLRVSV